MASLHHDDDDVDHTVARTLLMMQFPRVKGGWWWVAHPIVRFVNLAKLIRCEILDFIFCVVRTKMFFFLRPRRFFSILIFLPSAGYCLGFSWALDFLFFSLFGLPLMFFDEVFV